MHYRFQSGGRIYQVTIERTGESYRAIVDGKPYELVVLDSQPGVLSVRFAGKPLTLYWAADEGKKWISVNGCTYLLEKPSPASVRKAGEHTGEDTVRAAMPAQVRSVEVAEGDEVERGQTLILLEAMKMEIRVRAPGKGRIFRIHVKDGQSVERDQVLIEFRDQ